MDKIVCLTKFGFLIGRQIMFDMRNDQMAAVHGQGHIVRLRPVEVRVLLHFVEHPQMLLQRRHIFDQCWRKYGIEVGDNSLNQVVHSLRDAFHSLDPASSYIKTVPRIGYTLTAVVSPWEEPHAMPLESQTYAVA